MDYAAAVSEYVSIELVITFFLGQVSLAVLIGTFVAVFLFRRGPAPTSPTSASGPAAAAPASAQAAAPAPTNAGPVSLDTLAGASSPRRRAQRSASSGDAGHATATEHPLDTVSRHETSVRELLAAVEYVFMREKERESCNWLNAVLGHYIATCRVSDVFRGICHGLIDRSVNNPRRPSFIGPVTIRHLDLGTGFPIMDNIGLKPLPTDDSPAHVVVEAWMSWSDRMSVDLETQFVVRIGSRVLASLPVTMTVSVVAIHGHVLVNFVHLADGRQAIHAACAPDVEIDFRVSSSLGHLARLHDLPRITDLVVNRLRKAVLERISGPKGGIFIPLPFLQPPSQMASMPAPPLPVPTPAVGSVAREEAVVSAAPVAPAAPAAGPTPAAAPATASGSSATLVTQPMFVIDPAQGRTLPVARPMFVVDGGGGGTGLGTGPGTGPSGPGTSTATGGAAWVRTTDRHGTMAPALFPATPSASRGLVELSRDAHGALSSEMAWDAVGQSAPPSGAATPPTDVDSPQRPLVGLVRPSAQRARTVGRPSASSAGVDSAELAELLAAGSSRATTGAAQAVATTVASFARDPAAAAAVATWPRAQGRPESRGPAAAATPPMASAHPSGPPSAGDRDANAIGDVLGSGSATSVGGDPSVDDDDMLFGRVHESSAVRRRQQKRPAAVDYHDLDGDRPLRFLPPALYSTPDHGGMTVARRGDAPL